MRDRRGVRGGRPKKPEYLDLVVTGWERARKRKKRNGKMIEAKKTEKGDKGKKVKRHLVAAVPSCDRGVEAYL